VTFSVTKLRILFKQVPLINHKFQSVKQEWLCTIITSFSCSLFTIHHSPFFLFLTGTFFPLLFVGFCNQRTYLLSYETASRLNMHATKQHNHGLWDGLIIDLKFFTGLVTYVVNMGSYSS